MLAENGAHLNNYDGKLCTKTKMCGGQTCAEVKNVRRSIQTQAEMCGGQKCAEVKMCTSQNVWRSIWNYD